MASFDNSYEDFEELCKKHGKKLSSLKIGQLVGKLNFYIIIEPKNGCKVFTPTSKFQLMK